jgi:hypothetical protein
MKITKEELKSAIREVIEESFSEATIEEDAEVKVDINDDDSLSQAVTDAFIDALEELGSEGDYSSEGEDFDEDTGKVWATIDFNEDSLLEDAWEKVSEDIYDTLNLDYDTSDEESQEYKDVVRVEEFIEDNFEKLQDTKEVGKVVDNIRSEQAEGYEDAALYNKDPYAYYGVSRSDFI